MSEHKENDSKKTSATADPKLDVASKVHHASGGGQTDSATGGKPGGGGTAKK